MTHDKQQLSGYDRIQDSRKKFMIKRIKRCHEKSCGFNVEYLIEKNHNSSKNIRDDSHISAGETDDPNPAAGNTSNGDSVSTGDTTPYTQAQTVNRGMLIYDLGNGKKIELPPTKDSYDFLREMASRAAHVAVL